MAVESGLIRIWTVQNYLIEKGKIDMVDNINHNPDLTAFRHDPWKNKPKSWERWFLGQIYIEIENDMEWEKTWEKGLEEEKE